LDDAEHEEVESIEQEVTEQDDQEPESSEEAEQVESDEEEGEESDSGENLVIDGEEFEVPKELAPLAAKLKGLELSLRADHTRKTQEAAEIRKAATNFYEQTKQAAAFQTENVGYIAALLANQKELDAYENVDWATLAETDILAYTKHKEIRDGLREKAYKLSTELAQLQTRAQQQEEQQRYQKWQSTVEAVRKAIPNYDQTTDAKAVKAALALGEKYGIKVDGDALRQMLDPLVWIGLVELSKYQELLEKRHEISKRVAEAPRMSKPGAPAAKSRHQEATKRLKQYGRVEDLAKFL
ncbi:MAG: hypothetical protein ACK4RS_05900, partial [Thiothrix sp.]